MVIETLKKYQPIHSNHIILAVAVLLYIIHFHMTEQKCTEGMNMICLVGPGNLAYNVTTSAMVYSRFWYLCVLHIQSHNYVSCVL